MYALDTREPAKDWIVDRCAVREAWMAGRLRVSEASVDSAAERRARRPASARDEVREEAGG